MGVVPEGRDRVEVWTLVVGDVGSVVAENVPVTLLDQAEELFITEGVTVDGLASFDREDHALATDLVGILLGPPAEDGRNLVAGGG